MHQVRVNPQAPGRCGSRYKGMIFSLIIQNDNLGIHYGIALLWMPENSIHEKVWLGVEMQHAFIRANVDPHLCH